MYRLVLIITAICLAALISACGGNDTPVRISANELQKTFLADEDAARKRYSGKRLIITGEVAIATPEGEGWTMSGKVEIPARVYFRTELDYLESDIKHVVCEGDFVIQETGGGSHLDPRIAVGGTLMVECRPAKLKWSSPGLYLSGCRIADY